MIEPVMLKVEHKGEAKFVGKVLVIPVRGWQSEEHRYPIFYHEESGTQEHRTFGARSGIDAPVLYWLLQEGVQECHHLVRGGIRLYVAPTIRVRKKGKRAVMDQRDRIFLPKEQWAEFSRPWYDAGKWVKKELVIDWEDVRTGDPALTQPQQAGLL